MYSGTGGKGAAAQVGIEGKRLAFAELLCVEQVILDCLREILADVSRQGQGQLEALVVKVER